MKEIDQIAAIKNALGALNPSSLEVIDESHKHEGHGGWRAGQVTHIHVKIAAPAFAGSTRVAQHRTINNALKPFIDRSHLHAVRITIMSCE